MLGSRWETLHFQNTSPIIINNVLVIRVIDQGPRFITCGKCWLPSVALTRLKQHLERHKEFFGY